MTDTSPGHALRLEGVGKAYAGFIAVDNVTLDIARGEFLTLLGPSGSGKTTLLNIIAGFVTPDAGRVALDGRDITNLPPEARDFGMVFQGYALFPHMSVAENVAFPLRVRGIGRAAMAEQVRATLDLVQLTGFADRKPAQLSGGQQQRVALARALVFSPNLLLLDEPLSALDKKLRAELQEELRLLHRRVGLTFIAVTHDQEEALSMSDRVAILRHGKLVQVGAPAALYEKPRTRFVAEFLGKANFIAEPGGMSALRPEKIALLAPGASAPCMAEGALASWSYLGAAFDLVVECGALGALRVTTPAGGFAPQEGMALRLGWDTGAAVAVEAD